MSKFLLGLILAVALTGCHHLDVRHADKSGLGPIDLSGLGAGGAGTSGTAMSERQGELAAEWAREHPQGQ